MSDEELAKNFKEATHKAVIENRKTLRDQLRPGCTDWVVGE